jgi:hypothetical protein
VDYQPDLVLAANDKANAEAANRIAVSVSYRKAKAKRKG